jgi:hypothetical protein
MFKLRIKSPILLALLILFVVISHIISEASGPTTHGALSRFSGNWIIAIPISAFIIMLSIWLYKHRKVERNPVIVPHYEANQALSLLEVELLLKRASNGARGITAEIITLAIQGYLKITKEEGHYVFTNLRDFKELEGVPKIIMDGIFPLRYMEITNPDPGSPVSVDIAKFLNIQSLFYLCARDAMHTARNSLYEKGYTEKNLGLNLAAFFGILASLIALISIYTATQGWIWFLAPLLTALIIGMFGVTLNYRTNKGIEELRHIEGLKLFIHTAEKDRIKFHSNPEKTPEEFEKLLPYAIVFGLETEWTEQFKDIYTAPPIWYKENASLFDPETYTIHLNDFVSIRTPTVFWISLFTRIIKNHN